MNGQDSCMLEEYVDSRSLIVIYGMKVFCRILGLIHMTRKIGNEEQNEILKSRPSRKPYNHWRMFNTF